MRNFFLPLFTFGLLSAINQQCANQKSPTGGPKDTIPPTLTFVNPVHKSVNYKENIINLVFDENVNIDKLRNNLSITPLLDIKYKSSVRKNRVNIEFEESLPDSTTYTFNFFDGITDITEKSPVHNLIIAFSTGPYIDSLIVSGTIKDLYTQLPTKDMLVALYPFTDTLDLVTQTPMYFTTTTENGMFSIENIKNSQYKLFAFQDENRNKKFDPTTEAHALNPGTINLTVNLDSVSLTSNLIDVSEFTIGSARSFGRYFEIRYSKPVTNYEIELLDSSYNSTPHHKIVDNSIIRFYNTTFLKDEIDSIGIIAHVSDTLRTTLVDTLYVIFKSSNRKADPLTISLNPLTNKSFNRIYSSSLHFNTPIQQLNKDSIYFQKDSTLTLPLDTSSVFDWNHNQTILKFHIPFSWDNFSDSLNIINQMMSITDSSAQLQEHANKSINLIFASGTFISAEQDTSELINSKLTKIIHDDYGSLELNIKTEQTSFEVQILDKSGDVITSFKNKINHKFSFLKPGQYSIRILIDNNNDGYWSPGNYLDDLEPEDIYLHPDKTEIKANWEILIEDISF